MTTFDPLDAVLFDLDGVLTPTAEVHMRAWARLFEPFLAERAVAPYTAQDYFDYIDGKPRYEGVASLLASRGIDLPFGDPADAPESDTVCGLGNRKNAVFTAVLESDGVEPYPGSVAFLDALARRGAMHAEGQHMPQNMQVMGIVGSIGKLFASHPPMEERIAALRARQG